MTDKSLLLLLTFASIAFAAQINYQAIRGSLEKVNYYSESLTKGVTSGTLESTRKNLEELNKGLVGALSNIYQPLKEYVYNSLGKSTTDNPLIAITQGGFATVGRSLDRNLKAIQDLKRELKVEIRGLSLQGHLDDLESLVSLYEKNARRKSKVSVKKFLTACYQTRVSEKPLWFTNAVTIKDPGNLKHLILSEGNKEKLNSFYQQMLSLFFEAVLMNSACLAAEYATQDNETSETAKEEFAEDVQLYLNEFMEALDRDMDLLTNHFILFAVNDVDRCGEQFANYDNEDAVSCLASTFRAKYHRKFFALAFGARKSLSEQDFYAEPNLNNKIIRRISGKCDSYARTFLNFHQRNFLICFQSDCASQEWKDKADKCNKRFVINQNSCVEKVKAFAQCLRDKGAEFTLVACYYADKSIALNRMECMKRSFQMHSNFKFNSKLIKVLAAQAVHFHKLSFFCTILDLIIVRLGTERSCFV